MYAVVDPLYNKMYLISDTEVSPTLNQLDVYHQNVYIGTFNIAGTGSFSKVLSFSDTLTSYGNKYIFTFTPEDIGMSVHFDDYLYHFILSNSGTSPNPLFGTVVDRGIMCCMAKAMESVLAECAGCDAAKLASQQLDKIATVKSYLDGAKAAIRMKSVSTALCALKVIDSYCSDCGCYGS